MTLEETKQKMREILENTVQYYSEDITRRSYIIENGENSCVYISENKRCAVGRYLSDDILSKIISDELNKFVSYSDLKEAFELEPLLNLPDIFWDKLQALHDHDNHWEIGGLTEIGQRWVTHIKEYIDGN